jgi:hypothetical protein
MLVPRRSRPVPELKNIWLPRGIRQQMRILAEANDADKSKEERKWFTWAERYPNYKKGLHPTPCTSLYKLKLVQFRRNIQTFPGDRTRFWTEVRLSRRGWFYYETLLETFLSKRLEETLLAAGEVSGWNLPERRWFATEENRDIRVSNIGFLVRYGLLERKFVLAEKNCIYKLSNYRLTDLGLEEYKRLRKRFYGE